MPEVKLIQLATEEVEYNPQNPGVVTMYWAKGSTDLGDVILALRRQDPAPPGTVRVPPYLYNLPIVAMEPAYVGGSLWTVTVRYGVYERGATPAEGLRGDGQSSPVTNYPPGTEPPTTPTQPTVDTKLSRDWSFDVTSGTQVRKKSIRTRHKVAAPSIAPFVHAPDHEGSVNVTQDGVEGCEVVIPKVDITISRQVPYVTLQWLQETALKVGKVNVDRFIEFSPGELLLTGLSGSGREDGAWTVTWHFSASPNRREFLFEQDSTEDRKFDINGHDYVWYTFETKEKDGWTTHVPQFAYVERVYEADRFDLLGVFQG